MPNYLPYLILILVSIFILTYTIINQRQFGVFVLVISFSGMVYVAEFFVMVIGNCYYYKPEILSVPYYDNILGAIVSNLFILPALGVFAAYYKLRLKWIILFAITLVGVELAFEAMNITTQTGGEVNLLSLLLSFSSFCVSSLCGYYREVAVGLVLSCFGCISGAALVQLCI